MSPNFARNKRRVWELWRSSQTYHTTPSSLIGLRPGTLKAFYLDRGIHLWASRVESEMNQAESSTKNPKLAHGARVRILEKHLSANEPKKFKDPSAAAKKPDPKEDIEMVIGGD